MKKVFSFILVGAPLIISISFLLFSFAAPSVVFATTHFGQQNNFGQGGASKDTLGDLEKEAGPPLPVGPVNKMPPLPNAAANQQSSGQSGDTSGVVLLQPTLVEGVGSKEASANPGNYLAGLFKLAVGLAGVLAVVVLIWGGFEYIASAASPSMRDDAKKRIMAALGGLVLLVFSVTLAETINKKFVTFDLTLKSQVSSSGGVGGAGGASCSSSCTKVAATVPVKSGACAGQPGGGCSVDGKIAKSLDGVTEDAKRAGVSWYVTSTLRESNGCHGTGECADLSIQGKNGALPTVTEINTFAKILTDNNLAGTYEVTTDERKRQLAGVTNIKVEVNPKATGEHIHFRAKTGAIVETASL